jgi:hypothetical protein
MSLWILNNANTSTVLSDLKRICPDPALVIDVGAHPDGNLGGGAVSFQPAPTTTSVGCQMVQDLVNSPITIGIRGEADIWSVAPLAGRTLHDVGGVTVKDKYPSPTLIDIVYDAYPCNGLQFWVKDAAGNHIPAPPHVNLFHEMAHAHDLASGTFNVANPEPSAIAQENAYRVSMGLTQRAGHDGGCNMPAPTQAPPPKSNCFIATAAFGSVIEPEVQVLRSFRDNVLRKTRAGDMFFENYWKYYYRVSPIIVDAMEEDENVKHVVRWSVVTPIVRYLELLTSFPDASPEALPEPWRSFLLKIQSDLEAWTAEIGLPQTFRGLGVISAAQELGILLRYVLRSSEKRASYLTRLERSGELPLPTALHEVHTAADQLRSYSLSNDEIHRILGCVPNASLTPAGFYMNANEVLDASGVGGDTIYQVILTNLTGQPWQQAIVFYNQNNDPNTIYAVSQNNIQAGQVVVLELGICSSLQSYNVGIFDIQNKLAGQIPDSSPIFQGATTMTPALDRQIHPNDPPCISTWAVT